MDVNYRNVVCINMYITPLLLLKHEMYLNKTSEMSVHSLAQAKIIGIFIIHWYPVSSLVIVCFYK